MKPKPILPLSTFTPPDYRHPADPDGLPCRLVWRGPREATPAAVDRALGCFRIRLCDGRETGPIPRDATREDVEAAVREVQGRASAGEEG